MATLVTSPSTVPVHRITDRDGFEALLAREAGPRLAVEQIIAQDAAACAAARAPRAAIWRRRREAPIAGVPGFCSVCGTVVRFTLPSAAEGGAANFREELGCASCGLNNRQRFMAAHALQHLAARGEGSRLYAYEQRTAFFDRMCERVGDRAEGSEWVGPDVRPGDVVDGLRHEDATSLTFPDASFDVLVSNDVFEHVPDIHAALSEARRVLRPGGVLLFTVPFHGTDATEKCAELTGGDFRHLREPEYHGDPVHPQAGSLVFYRFGWDLLDFCRAAGFADAALIAYYTMVFGHIGAGLQYAFQADVAAAPLP